MKALVPLWGPRSAPRCRWKVPESQNRFIYKREAIPAHFSTRLASVREGMISPWAKEPWQPESAARARGYAEEGASQIARNRVFWREAFAARFGGSDSPTGRSWKGRCSAPPHSVNLRPAWHFPRGRGGRVSWASGDQIICPPASPPFSPRFPSVIPSRAADHATRRPGIISFPKCPVSSGQVHS